MKRGTAALAVAAIALALPATAGARTTKTVQAGPFGTAAAKFEAASGDANQFFRRTITIHKGDSVRWNVHGFHTVTFQPEGDPAPGLVVADPSQPVSGSLDAAGDPFWFNGQAGLFANPVAVLPQGGKKLEPGVLANSGLPQGEGAFRYKLRFRFKGTFNYLCIVHPYMAGTVRVVGKNKRIPSKAKDRRVAKREQRRALERVQELTTGAGTETLTDTIQAGNDTQSGATVFKFFPSAPTFKVGTTVTLQMAPTTTEAHTFTFGPTNGKDQYLDVLAQNLFGQAIDPRGGYPSEEPPGVPHYDGGNHGNGFFNTGLLDGDTATPNPAAAQVKFTKAGSYSMICLLHPFMKATVTVTTGQ
jgi:plastocyanin